MNLTGSQQRAIEHELENLQLIACAGSGKTEVVALRVVHLLDPKSGFGLSPRNIVAFTFTEKAAAELKERIIRRVHEALGDVPGLAEMYIGTIHAFCLDLLKTEVPKYSKFEILNEVQQGLFVDRHSKQSGLTVSADLQGNALVRYRDTRNYLAALSILSESDLVPTELKGCSLTSGKQAYAALIDSRCYLDYSSVLTAAVDVLTDDKDLRKRLRERIRYVIVDEYQDVNPIQEAIVRSLHDLGAKVCVVGDDDQTIYQWRGSDVENILKFENRYPKVTTVPLEENFRSSDGIVETARDFIKQNAVRLTKAMKPTSAQPYEVGDITALSFKDQAEEADYIVKTVKSLRGIAFTDDGKERGLSWSDMAVLMRSVKREAEPIMQALRHEGIPFVVVGMANLFGTREAEAARQLFYFMAGRTGATAGTVAAAWANADLGIDPKLLRAAITTASGARKSLENDDENRWGTYSIQRVFLDFLEQIGLFEERVPDNRGEVVFYNLGKFSQLISDFESIHYKSKPREKYESFANFLEYRAEDAYPEGWQDNHYASPDAVRLMTVHQSKGMQWPVVFIPGLIRNRFPQKKPGGRSVWHLLPRSGVKRQPRYEGTTEDERRLFYVAMTRSQKFLHMTWSPVAGNQLAQQASDFWHDVLASKWVKRRLPAYTNRKRRPPQPRASVANVVFSFSDLKYFFECPYQFKLRILYGFNAPIHEGLGYGKSLHDALAEVHARAIRGDIAEPDEADKLVETHLHAPYAYPALKEALEKAAEKVIKRYIKDNRKEFKNLEFSEKQIEISMGGGVSVKGRIDLVRRIDTDETTIVDLKSSDRAQPEEVTEAQLHVYALGYQELTHRRADYVEIYELDEGKRKARSVDDEFIADVKSKINDAATALRTSTLSATPTEKKCASCDYRGMCLSAAKPVVKKKAT